VEIRAGGEASDQYQDLGPIAEGSLVLSPRSQPRAGGLPTQFGFGIETSFKVLATGTNMRAALTNILDNFAEIRITDVNGHKYTFVGTTSTVVGEIDLTIQEDVAGQFEGARMFSIAGAGYITMARFTAMYAEA